MRSLRRWIAACSGHTEGVRSRRRWRPRKIHGFLRCLRPLLHRSSGEVSSARRTTSISWARSFALMTRGWRKAVRGSVEETLNECWMRKRSVCATPAGMSGLRHGETRNVILPRESIALIHQGDIPRSGPVVCERRWLRGMASDLCERGISPW
jgi:hypothetical protein